MKNQAIYQCTIKKPVSFVGLGLHSGARSRITIRPCYEATGIFFRRMDVTGDESRIAAKWYNITDTTLSTGLTNRHGHTVSTVEHLMAALRLCGIDNAEIEVTGSEIPIMDGSAKPFVDSLLKAGKFVINEPRKAIWVHKAIEVTAGERRAMLLPDTQPGITVSIDFEEKAIGLQSLTVDVNDHNLLQEIAPARTFGFVNQIEKLRNQGLVLGGSLNNAVLVDNDRVVNSNGLRFENEFVRHKILDTIGDLALIGVPLIGDYRGFKSGHYLNKLLINKLLSNKSAWSYIRMDDFYQLHGEAPRYTDDYQVEHNLSHASSG